MGILEIIAIILLFLWLGGFALHVAGSFIHLLLVVAVIMIVIRFLKKST